MFQHELFGVRIDDISDAELEQLLAGWLHEDTPRVIVTPNPEFLLEAQKSPDFAKKLNESHLSLPDGVGLRYAIAAMTDNRLLHRHTGVDVLEGLAKLCEEQGRTLLLFGGDPGSAEVSSQVFKKRYPNLAVIFFDPGWVDLVHLSSEIISRLQAAAPTVLAVALGQNKQEACIEALLPHLPSLRIAIGVGGALEMLSGKRPRAPHFFRRAGLEWLWRLVLEPSRTPRIFRAVVVFPFVVASATLKQHRFWKACVRVLSSRTRKAYRA